MAAATACAIATGQQKWQTVYNIANEGPNGASVGYGKVFVSASPYDFVALDSGTGKEVWRTKLVDVAKACQPGAGACTVVDAPPPGTAASTIATPKINLPPTSRFNAGFTFDYGRVLTDLSVQYTSAAYFRDVLDATYAAWTEPFTVVNAGVSVRLYGNNATAGIKIRNLGNEPVQNHVFGDLLKRQILFELRLRR